MKTGKKIQKLFPTLSNCIRVPDTFIENCKATWILNQIKIVSEIAYLNNNKKYKISRIKFSKSNFTHVLKVRLD